MSSDSPDDVRQAEAASAPRRRNLPMLGRLALFALMMFGFGWAMIPLYNAICEVTGINNLTKRDESAEAFAKSTQVDTSRTVRIEFDANRHGPWQFKPAMPTLDVHPGELATVEYELVNTGDSELCAGGRRALLPQAGVLLLPAADAGGQGDAALPGGLRDRSEAA